jgi:acyl-homoserine-lactone acylase
MRKILLSPLLLLLLTSAADPADLTRWKAEAARVTIVRDDWGIAHVSGRTDADAVFGMIYAQAEDDFPRIEANYLTSLGRTAEAEDEKAIWQDLRSRLYYSPETLQANYAQSPEWLKRLMNAWADGLNYYLASHPNVHPRAITRFEPWMAMSFTEGSIGGDIERIDLDELRKFYTGKEVRTKTAVADAPMAEPQGSNGIAISPRITAPGTGALLLINPHTSFYFRSELQMKSEEGLNAYGAVTWGQFFIYQGFNPHAGWMHTSTGADAVDEFAYEVRQPELGPRYRYGNEWRVMEQRPVTIRYKKPDGSFGSRTFTTYYTHRGPIVRSELTSACAPGSKTIQIAAGAKDQRICWIAFAMMDRPIPALEQSYLRTKTTDLASFLIIADLQANSSNHTLFADDKGNIAYLHPQFIPVRDDRFEYTKVADGSNPATDWRGLTPLNRLPNAINPPNGWVDNNNNHPWSSAGAYSPKAADFPKYMDMFGENFRGLHALRLLEGSSGWTLPKLNAAAFDSFQPGFATLVPPLIKAYDTLPKADPRRAKLAAPIAALRGWDYRWSGESVPQSLAMFWGDALYHKLKAEPGEPGNKKMMRLTRDTTSDEKLAALSEAVARLTRDFGRWQVPWREINRFQRISPAIEGVFDDSKPSIPVPFASGNYGSLASFGSSPKPGTKKWYGTSGNSFVAVVQFGPGRVRARAVTAGGESGHPSSPHFTDEALRYASGALREVYFYPDQLKGHTERVYHPGG